MNKTLTPGAVAAQLHVPVNKVRAWLRDGTLHGTKVNNRWQIDEAVLLRHIRVSAPAGTLSQQEETAREDSQQKRLLLRSENKDRYVDSGQTGREASPAQAQTDETERAEKDSPQGEVAKTLFRVLGGERPTS